MTVKPKVTFFWNMTPSSLVGRCKNLEEPAASIYSVIFQKKLISNSNVT